MSVHRGTRTVAARAGAWAGIGLAIALPTACGSSTGNAGLSTSQPPSASPSASAPAAGGGGAQRSLPPVGASSRTITVSGTVEPGAEPSCLILRGDRGEYELQGPLVAKLRRSERVRVTGHVVHGVMSHCMQGQPFVVTSVDSP